MNLMYLLVLIGMELEQEEPDYQEQDWKLGGSLLIDLQVQLEQ